MRKLDESRILGSCEAARKSLIPTAMLAFVPPIQAEMQTAISNFIKIFEDAATRRLANSELLYDAADQVMQYNEPRLNAAVQHCFPTEWQGFVALMPAANQFLRS